ncbi:MAG: deoxyribonuclease IV [Nitrospirota bacterium]|nr:deoxyribonuclease IV [Nitrospirota bacterium]
MTQTAQPVDEIQIGCHISTAGGVDKSPPRGAELGAGCMQIFTRNQMSWSHKDLGDAEIKGFAAGVRQHGIGTVMSHDSYLINLCSPDPDKHAKSLAGFMAEVERCTRLGIGLLNFHPGAHMGKGVEWGIATIADSLNRVTAAFPDTPVKLVLETVAGQGSTVGRSFAELAAILERLEQPQRFGICVDTAHVFAAGYAIDTEAGWNTTWEEFERLLGLEKLLAFHVNDSKVKRGSHVDRHALIGRGHIGPDAFLRLVTDPRTRCVPMMLETPAGEGGYAAEIAWLTAAAHGEVPPLPEIAEVKRGY